MEELEDQGLSQPPTCRRHSPHPWLRPGPPASLPSEAQELSGGLELSFSSMGFPKGDKAMPKFTKSEPLTFLFNPCQREILLIDFILE